MGPQPIHSMDSQELGEITKALRRSYEVLCKSRARSKEARKVTDMISLLFAKLDPTASSQQIPNSYDDRPDSRSGWIAEGIPSFLRGMPNLKL